jgi:hypothetical protein
VKPVVQEASHDLRRRSGLLAVVGQPRLPDRQINRDCVTPLWRLAHGKEHDRREPHDRAVASCVGTCGKPA